MFLSEVPELEDELDSFDSLEGWSSGTRASRDEWEAAEATGFRALFDEPSTLSKAWRATRASTQAR